MAAPKWRDLCAKGVEWWDGDKTNYCFVSWGVHMGLWRKTGKDIRRSPSADPCFRMSSGPRLVIGSGTVNNALHTLICRQQSRGQSFDVASRLAILLWNQCIANVPKDARAIANRFPPAHRWAVLQGLSFGEERFEHLCEISPLLAVQIAKLRLYGMNRERKQFARFARQPHTKLYAAFGPGKRKAGDSSTWLKRADKAVRIPIYTAYYHSGHPIDAKPLGRKLHERDLVFSPFLYTLIPTDYTFDVAMRRLAGGALPPATDQRAYIEALSTRKYRIVRNNTKRWGFQAAQRLTDTFNMLADLKSRNAMSDSMARVWRSCDVAEYLAVHDEAAVRVRSLDYPDLQGEFPSVDGMPDVEMVGGVEIRRLTSFNALVEEGTAQHHCVGSPHLGRMCMRGELAVYAFAGDGVRLTVGITLKSAKHPGMPERPYKAIYQAHGTNNKTPNTAEMHVLAAWCGKHKISQNHFGGGVFGIDIGNRPQLPAAPQLNAAQAAELQEIFNDRAANFGAPNNGLVAAAPIPPGILGVPF